jgi:hypothetical protein
MVSLHMQCYLQSEAVVNLRPLEEVAVNSTWEGGSIIGTLPRRRSRFVSGRD